MFIIDTALEKRIAADNPIRVAINGAGYMARAITLELVLGSKGIEVVAIANRTLAKAEQSYRLAGVTGVQTVTSIAALEEAVRRRQPAITDDPTLICDALGIDAVVEVTGELELGAEVAIRALQHGKHLISVNAQIDTAIGSILRVYADRAGVVFTNTDGDEPGVAMNLVRFLRTVGYLPLLAGNMKGFIDRHRTPETQAAFAAKYNQLPRMITSFADGTKLSMECAILANAAGFSVGQRGMFGPKCDHVTEVTRHFTAEQLLASPLVDYTLGAAPNNGAFVVAYTDHPIRQQYMSYFKMGDGPLYVFYTPYHLPQVQVAMTIARAVLFNDPTVTPAGAPTTDVVTLTKRPLKAGEVLDGIGGFMSYGLIDNATVAHRDNLLPISLSEGCRLRHDVDKDRALTCDDVVVPEGRLVDRLRAEQHRHFAA